MGPDSSLTPETIQAQAFTTTFRGYDTSEVKAFLNRVATDVRAWRERAEHLESAWHSAEERAARPPVLDEDTLMAAVGEETAAILRTARAAAADLRTKAAEDAERAITEATERAERALSTAREESELQLSQSRAEADRLLAEAQAEATRLRTEAQSALDRATEEAQAEANALLAQARVEVASMLERAQADAEEMREEADKERRLTIEGAHTTRDRILEDLSRRRRVATVQIEQLRAGRERLVESYAIVRRTLDEVQSELSRADAEARSAADDVGRRLKDEPEVELTESTRPITELIEDATVGAEGDRAVDVPAALEVELAGTPLAGLVGSAVDELFARIRATKATAPESDAPVEEPEGSTAEPEGSASEPEATAPGPDAAAPGPDAAAPAAEDEPPSVELPTVEPAVTGEVTVVDVASVEVPGVPPPKPAPLSKSGAKRARRRGQGAQQPAPEASAPVAEPAAEPVPEAQPEPEPASAGQEEPEPAVADGDEGLLQLREGAVVDLEVNLTRRLKRALQDEQNDVLDRLRNLRGEVTADRLLPSPPDQMARYADSARPLLVDAVSAGTLFTVETTGGDGVRDVEVDVADLAGACAKSIVEPLRRRLEQSISSGAGEDPAFLIETLGAAYREWKTQRIERLAGDVVSTAFSRGTWASAPEGALFRWVVDDVDGPCPDCDDDALAGDLPKGEVFPTGQHHPPAHSGCRCLLVPIRAVG
jgi:DivIVA domain-containing protein